MNPLYFSVLMLIHVCVHLCSCPICRRELIAPVPSIEALEAQSDERLRTQVHDIVGTKASIDVNSMNKNEMAIMIHEHMMQEEQRQENEDLLEEEREREEALGLEPRVASSSHVDPLQSATNLQRMIEAESTSRYEINEERPNSSIDLVAIERMIDAAAAPAVSSSLPTTTETMPSSSSIPRERDYDEFSEFIDAMASGNASQYERTSGEEVNDTDTMFPGGIMIRSHRDTSGGGNLMSYSIHPTSVPGVASSRAAMPMATSPLMTRTSEDGMGANDSTILNYRSTPTLRTSITRNDLEGID